MATKLKTKTSSFITCAQLMLIGTFTIIPLQMSSAQSNPLGGLINSLQGLSEGQAEGEAQNNQNQAQDQKTQEALQQLDQLTNEGAAPNQSVNQSENPNLFFDGNAPTPQQSQMSQDSAPRVVNPQRQPASRLVIVQKDAGPESMSARLIAAGRAMKLGRVDSALNLYEELYMDSPTEPAILLGLAVAYQRVGQEDAAIDTYNELLDVNPDNVEAQINMLGLMGSRYPAVSLRNLQALRADHPGHIGILAQIAFINAQIGRFDEAMETLGVAASLEPNNPNHVYNIAVIADKAGDVEKAVKYYQQALEIDTVYSNQVIPREAVFERMAALR